MNAAVARVRRAHEHAGWYTLLADPGIVVMLQKGRIRLAKVSAGPQFKRGEAAVLRELARQVGAEDCFLVTAETMGKHGWIQYEPVFRAVYRKGKRSNKPS